MSGKYNQSDYAINKNRKGIVYRNSDGSILEITFEKVAEGNPEFTAEDFEKLKEFSDSIYHEQAKGDSGYSSHKDQFTETEGENSPLKTKFLEDEYFANMDDIEFEKKLYRIIDEKLTPTQRRRILMYMEGINTVKIAEIENCYQSSVWESLEAARKKISKFLNIF